MNDPQTNFRRAILLRECPALKCDYASLERITERSKLFADLEAVARAKSFDYYCCEAGGCRRIWRIERCDGIHGELYREPEWIGSWNGAADSKKLIIFQSPRSISLKYKYRPSKSNPTRPARNKEDAAYPHRR